MEKVYGCGELDYTSNPICLRDFLNDASLQQRSFEEHIVTDANLSKQPTENVFRERMMEMMDSNLTDSEFLDLENICCADNLKSPGSRQSLYGLEHGYNQSFIRGESVSDSDLETHKRLCRRARIHERFLKYTGVVWLDKNIPATVNNKSANIKNKSANEPANNTDLIPGNELVATVRFYAPFRHEVGKRNRKVVSGCQEMVILGSQTLADLRDKFACASDNIICQDLSSNPFRKSATQAKDKYKSGMMYIAEKFYDDMRHSTNVEYSEQVLKWAKERCLHLGTKARMEHSKIIDLTVKLGYPYLYQHQGNCEHIFCFSDIRLLEPSDLLQSSKYPLFKTISRQHSRYCMLCGHYVAKWVTIGNSRVPHDPCYFCQACFLSYNYINKKKVGDFAAYPFSEATFEATETV